ncbi:hypothetical protein B0H19DRAFT_934429, partial [Mycena capillaripes]
MYGGRSHAYASVKNLFSSSLLPNLSQESELSDLLRTNSVPAEPGPLASHIRSVIASSRSEVGRYDINIRTLRAALDKLVSERDILERHAHRCRSVFAPIRSLPPELLLKIFAHCSPDSQLDNPSGTWNRSARREHMEGLAKPHLLRLSRVCSGWHTVVMGSPSLWATIEV